MLKNDCIGFSKTDSFYLRPLTYQSPLVCSQNTTIYLLTNTTSCEECFGKDFIFTSE